MDFIRPERAFQNLLDLRITSVARILYLSKLRVTLVWIALTGQNYLATRTECVALGYDDGRLSGGLPDLNS
jgi:hypothetical protein